MDREKYLTELEEYLQPLTPEERADAIMYYSEYIEDAELETRQQIEESLGSPKSLSRKVLADYSIRSTEKEVENQRTAKPASNVKMIWLILLALLASPFILGLGGVLVAVLIAVICLVVAGVFAAGVLLCGGVVLLGVLLYTGIGMLFTSWAVGLFYLGLGLLVLGLLLVAFPIAYWLVRVILQGIGNLSRYLYEKVVKKGDQKKGDVTDEEDL